jgi:hypothetical protein
VGGDSAKNLVYQQTDTGPNLSQYLAVEDQTKIRIRSAERVSGGLIITFDDGKSALYSASLLRDAFSQAEQLKETAWDDLGLNDH